MPTVRHKTQIPIAALIALLTVLVALPARAQTGVQVGASAGVDGWIERGEPFVVRVEIDAEILLDGIIRTSMGGIDVTTDAQVPAGTSKVYEIQMPPATGQQVRVTITDASDVDVAEVSVSTRMPSDEVLVGTGPGIDPAQFDRTTSAIVDRPVVALEVDPATSGFALFDHLVVSSSDVGPGIVDWVETGGTLVTDTLPVGEAMPLATTDDVGWFGLGDGLILVVDDLSTMSNHLDLLLPGDVGLDRMDPWQDPDRALTEAASNSGRGGIPDLPWLLAAIAGYVILVVPVNFLVLHRAGKRDWAWITIPAISLLALGGFWLVGTQRLDAVSLSHATVVIGGERPESRSSMVLAVGSPGEYELGLAGEAILYPGSVIDDFDEFGRPRSLGGAEVTGSTARFRLEQLGFAGVSAIGAVEPDLPTVSFDGRTVTVENVTDQEYWAWGVSDGSIVSARREPLAPGATDAVEPRGPVGAGQDLGFREPGFGMNVGDAIVNELQLWNDERGWQVLSPIGRAAQFSFDEIPELFWFGFTETLHPEVTLDGDAVEPTGTSLVVVPIPSTDVPAGAEQGRLIDAGTGFVESGGGPGEVFVTSDEMWLRFDLPHGSTPTELAFLDQFGMRPGTFALWNWETSELEPIAVGASVDERFVDPAGRIVMRVGAEGAVGAQGEGFVEIPMSPRSVTIGWVRS